MSEIKYNKHGIPEGAREETNKSPEGLTNGNNPFGLKLTEKEAADFAENLLRTTEEKKSK